MVTLLLIASGDKSKNPWNIRDRRVSFPLSIMS